MNPQTPNFKSASLAVVKLLEQFPIRAGNIAKNHFLDSFKTESWEGDKWESRKPNPFETNKKRRALLVGSATLKRSIQRVESGLGFVKVATNVPYAEIHNEGGTITQTPTFKQRMFFSHASDAFYARKNMQEGRKFAAMSRATKIVIKIPKRQYMGHSDTLNRKIETAIMDGFGNIVEKALFNNH